MQGTRMRQGGQSYARPTFTPGEISRYSFYRKLSVPQDQSGHERVKKNLHAHRHPGRPARSQAPCRLSHLAHILYSRVANFLQVIYSHFDCEVLSRLSYIVNEQLQEFKCQCHLLGHFRSSSLFCWQQWIQVSKNINSGIWGSTRHLSLKITNSLAIFRLRKPLKASTRLVGHGFEPGTSRMRVPCVTTEPPRSVKPLY